MNGIQRFNDCLYQTSHGMYNEYSATIGCMGERVRDIGRDRRKRSLTTAAKSSLLLL